MTTEKIETPDTTPMLKTSHLAKRFGMKQTQLRRILRNMPAYADGVHTNYRWPDTPVGHKAIGEIEAKIQQLKNAREAKAKAAKAALDAKATAAANQAKTDKKAA